MNLAFSETINRKPTFFIQNIWNGFNNLKDRSIPEQRADYFFDYEKKFGECWDQTDIFESNINKIHTIRADKKGRWKVGNNIHFVINNRTKNRFQFAPVIKVTGIQEIRIRGFCVWVDGKLLSGERLKKITVNDGFETSQEFFEYFKQGFDGKIIHWTDEASLLYK